MNKIIIAIDGYSSCGKSTMARRLARAIGYTYVDSGAMYRAVTLYALRHNLLPDHMDTLSAALASGCVNITFGSVSEGDGVAPTLLNAENVEQAIRTPRVSASVSLVAAQPFVRQALTAQQQAMGQGGGVVMDGRDIGTTVFPKAQLKVFVTARPEVRARRRWLELQARGDQTALESVLNNVMERDRLDATRTVSPLRQAPDAIVLDNSDITPDEQHAWLLARYRSLCPEAPIDETK